MSDSAQFPNYKEARRKFEAVYVRRVLMLANGNIAAAARIAGKDRHAFYDIMDRAGVPRPRITRGSHPRGSVYAPPPEDPGTERWGVDGGASG